MGGRRCDVLSQCERTTVQSPFLEALLSGETKKYYPGEWASNFLAQGHDRVQPARQALCYILRQALGIVRMPNTYDVKIRADLFDNIDPSDLDSAVEDARRIYEFTQAEMKRVWAEDTITLKRGLRDKEAGVARALFDELGPETQTVPLYFNSLTFSTTSVVRSMALLPSRCPALSNGSGPASTRLLISNRANPARSSSLPVLTLALPWSCLCPLLSGGIRGWGFPRYALLALGLLRHAQRPQCPSFASHVLPDSRGA